MPRLSTHHAEVVLSVALAFLWFQFAIWPQDAFIDLGGGWVGAVRTPQVCIHWRFVILWRSRFPSSCLSPYRLSYCCVTRPSSRSKFGLPSTDIRSLRHSGRPSSTCKW